MARRLLGLVALAALLGLVASTALAKEPSPSRTVPCAEVIDEVAFPFVGTRERSRRYRQVLGVVAVPPAHLPQVVPTRTTPWAFWHKAGLVVRGGAEPVTVTVPAVWRTRAAIEWGYAHRGGPFASLRLSSCGSDRSVGHAYSGGFLLSTRSACVPLVFRVGDRSATVRFGVGRRCGG